MHMYMCVQNKLNNLYHERLDHCSISICYRQCTFQLSTLAESRNDRRRNNSQMLIGLLCLRSQVKWLLSLCMFSRLSPSSRMQRLARSNRCFSLQDRSTAFYYRNSRQKEPNLKKIKNKRIIFPFNIIIIINFLTLQTFLNRSLTY